MEIDVVYLSALIQDCNDPVSVLRESKLPGECADEEAARNVLMEHFQQPLVYRQETHGNHLEAMRYLGVDVPLGEEVTVLAYKQSIGVTTPVGPTG